MPVHTREAPVAKSPPRGLIAGLAVGMAVPALLAALLFAWGCVITRPVRLGRYAVFGSRFPRLCAYSGGAAGHRDLWWLGRTIYGVDTAATIGPFMVDRPTPLMGGLRDAG